MKLQLFCSYYPHRTITLPHGAMADERNIWQPKVSCERWGDKQRVAGRLKKVARELWALVVVKKAPSESNLDLNFYSLPGCCIVPEQILYCQFQYSYIEQRGLFFIMFVFLIFLESLLTVPEMKILWVFTQV